MNFIGYVPLICDIALVIAFIVTMVIMARKGFIKSIYRILSLVITVVLVAVLAQPVTGILEESQAGAVIYRGISEKLNVQNEQNLAEGKKGIDTGVIWNMPDYIRNSDALEGIQNEASSAVARTMTNVILKLISSICLFLIIKLLLSFLFLLLESIFKLPLLKSVNAFAGMLAGIVSVLAAVYIVCAIISLNIPMLDGVKDVISDTYIIKYFYNYNILMNIFI